jgi:pimeloyl-ACP methyl ester carboxylesterase
VRETYARLSPDGVAHWPVVIDRIRALWLRFTPWPRADLAKIKAPTMIVVGDGDAVRIEHAVDMFRAIPGARLYVLPGTGHSTFNQRTDWIAPVVEGFFAEPIKP